MKRISIFIIIGLFFWVEPALAHCPLCTVGAGFAASIAIWLGVNTVVVGVLLGAFAAALGLWMARAIKRKFFRGQDSAVAMIIFLSTILPLLPIAGGEKTSFYISLAGSYGTYLNRTYVIDLFLTGSVLGALILIISPLISKKLTKLRKDKTFPYQGIIITFTLLVISSIILQFLT